MISLAFAVLRIRLLIINCGLISEREVARSGYMLHVIILELILIFFLFNINIYIVHFHWVYECKSFTAIWSLPERHRVQHHHQHHFRVLWVYLGENIIIIIYNKLNIIFLNIYLIAADRMNNNNIIIIIHKLFKLNNNTSQHMIPDANQHNTRLPYVSAQLC